MNQTSGLFQVPEFLIRTVQDGRRFRQGLSPTLRGISKLGPLVPCGYTNADDTVNQTIFQIALAIL